MRFLPWLILLAVLIVNPVSADPNNLAGGVLIAHNPPQIEISGIYNCNTYYNELQITDASEQVNRIDDLPCMTMGCDVWYVIAAFTEDKIWCGTQFGLGDYNLYVFYMTGPGFTCLEQSMSIPTAGWPGPNEGISIVATTIYWEGNFQLIYQFEGYAYLAEQGDFTPTVIPITTCPGQDFIGFGNCETPPQLWPAEGGAMGIFTDGIAVYPSPPPLGACCADDDSCTLTDEYDCAGRWLPDETSCDPNPCMQSPTESPSWGDIKTLYR